eukprot:COSAG02_NODE_30091_length_557_cov_1.117904_1_plen_97_part_10
MYTEGSTPAALQRTGPDLTLELAGWLAPAGCASWGLLGCPREALGERSYFCSASTEASVQLHFCAAARPRPGGVSVRRGAGMSKALQEKLRHVLVNT